MWELIYTNNKKVTSDTNILNFQYKIVNRLLACNYNLNLWKIKPTNTCEHCESTDNIDNIEHHLVWCTETLSFWKKIFERKSSNLEVNFTIQTYKIIFGIPNEREEAIVNQINYVILYGKYYIYANKKKNMKLELFEFLLEC